MKQKLKGVPKTAGVYYFTNSKGVVIYVGKAKNLRSRLTSYFATHLANIKTYQMMKNAVDFNFIATETEREAFLLESNMIKADKPKYNILLKDSKTYPYVKITQEEYPRIFYTRDTRDQNAKYFGPFIGGGNLKNIMGKLQQVFPMRSCSNQEFAKGKLCLLYQIKRCVAPCEGLVTKEEYNQIVRKATMFFDGETEEIKEILRKEEEMYAQKLNFERANGAKYQLDVIDNIFQTQTVSDITEHPTDVFYLYQYESLQVVSYLFIRNKHIIAASTELFTQEHTNLLQAFIYQFYNNNRQFPKMVVTAGEPVEEGFAENLQALAGTTIKHRVRGFAGVVAMAHRNAEIVAKNHMAGIAKHHWLSKRLALLVGDNPQEAAYDRYEEEINVSRETFTSAHATSAHATVSPHINHIECMDISHSYGDHTVGVSVAYRNGKDFKAAYRKYRIRTATNDDFTALAEVLKRKIDAIKEGKDRKADLYIIDGGKGQLSAAWEIVAQSGMDINMIAISKGRSIKRAKASRNEGVMGDVGVQDVQSGDYFSVESIHTVGGEVVKLKGGDPLLLLIQRLRNEAHRFAIKYMRTLMNNSVATSIIREVDGVGDARLTRIMSRIPDIAHRKGITPQEIHEITGVPMNICQRISDKLR